MTIRDFTGKLWYAQRIAIIKWKDYDKCKDIDDIRKSSLFFDENYKLRSEVYKSLNDYLVDSYGVIDNILIIEVHG